MQTTASVSRRAVLAACVGQLGTTVAAATEVGHEWRPWRRERPVPKLDLPRLDGGRFRLAEQRGRIVLANFWATWCEPCRAEMPSLQRLAQRHEADALSVVAVNYRESPATIRRFLDGTGLELPVLLDADGEAAIAWTPRIFPSTVVFDRQSRPLGVVVGEIDWDGSAARELLAPLLARKA